MDVERLMHPAAGDAGQIDTVRALLHDLREPLAAIRLLASSGEGDAPRRMAAISEQATWLATVVESTLSTGSHDALVLADVRDCVAPVCERVRTATTTHIRVEAVGDCLAWVRPVALGRALCCLLDNAVRAAGPDGHITVHLEADEKDLVLQVIDDGPGPGHVAPRTSLGLTTTRAMVAECHGSFRLVAGAEGGAVAEIRLPSAFRVQLVR